MNALIALFTRALREHMRSRLTIFAHVSLVALILTFTFYTQATTSGAGAPGLELFRLLMWLNTGFIALAGIGHFSSAITEEKEGGTLGLLRMTELNALSILLGKSTSRLCVGLMLLATQLPYTLLAITLGGVSVAQLTAAYLSLGALTFFLCQIALLASVLAPRTSSAATATGLVWLALSFAPHLSPLDRLRAIFATGFTGPVAGPHVMWQLAGGALAFALAWALFERFASGQSGELTATPKRGWWMRGPGRPGRPAPYRAVEWKEFHFACGGPAIIAAKLAFYAAAGALYLVLWTGRGHSFENSAINFAGILALVMIGELGITASRILRLELRDGTLGPLALIPQSLREIVRAKSRACRNALWPAFALFAVVAVLFYLGYARRSPEHFFGATGALLIGGALAGGYLWLQCALGVRLVAYLTLRMSHGALPLGLAIMLTANFMPIVIPLFGHLTLLVVSAVLIGVLEEKIYLRLEERVAAD